MTQNPYQQYPPPGYPPQGPPAGPPPGYPGGPAYDQGQPAGYPPPAPAYAQPAAPAYGTPPADVPTGDGFGDPGSGVGSGDAPAVHQLEGRMVFIRPVRMHPDGKKFGTQEPEDQMIVDIVVCDGPPIPAHVNGNTGAATPFAAGPKVAPFFIGGAIVNKAIMDKVMDYLPSRGTCLGRLVKRPARGAGKPWNDLAPVTEQEKVLAREIFARWDELKVAATAVRPDQFAVAAQPQQPQYGQQTQVPQPGQWPTQYPQNQPAGPPPGQYQGQQQPQYGPPPGAPAYGTPPTPPPGYLAAAAGPAQPQQWPPVPAVPEPGAPGGWPQQGYPGPGPTH